MKPALFTLLGLALGGCQCGAAPRTEIPDLEARRARGPIVIDGVLDEADWERANRTEPFVSTMTGEPAAPRVIARVLHDDAHLYVAFEVEDDHLHADLEGVDPHLWTQDVVEVMVDPHGEGEGYFELQLSPAEQVFDTRFDRPREPRPFGHLAWRSELEGRVVIRGTLNDDRPDEGYVAELAIPWASFDVGPRPAARPALGDTWRVALYVMDLRPDGGQRAVGWSPPLVGDFHVPERFGRITFVQ